MCYGVSCPAESRVDRHKVHMDQMLVHWCQMIIFPREIRIPPTSCDGKEVEVAEVPPNQNSPFEESTAIGIRDASRHSDRSVQLHNSIE